MTQVTLMMAQGYCQDDPGYLKDGPGVSKDAPGSFGWPRDIVKMTLVVLWMAQGVTKMAQVTLRMAQGCCKDDTDHFTDVQGYCQAHPGKYITWPGDITNGSWVWCRLTWILDTGGSYMSNIHVLEGMVSGI